jgi:hypothetical protein
LSVTDFVYLRPNPEQPVPVAVNEPIVTPLTVASLLAK